MAVQVHVTHLPYPQAGHGTFSPPPALCSRLLSRGVVTQAAMFSQQDIHKSGCSKRKPNLNVWSLLKRCCSPLRCCTALESPAPHRQHAKTENHSHSCSKMRSIWGQYNSLQVTIATCLGVTGDNNPDEPASSLHIPDLQACAGWVTTRLKFFFLFLFLSHKDSAAI